MGPATESHSALGQFCSVLGKRFPDREHALRTHFFCPLSSFLSNFRNLQNPCWYLSISLAAIYIITYSKRGSYVVYAGDPVHHGREIYSKKYTACLSLACACQKLKISFFPHKKTWHNHGFVRYIRFRDTFAKQPTRSQTCILPGQRQ